VGEGPLASFQNVEMRKGRGSHFVPALFDLFLANLDTMREIHEANPDVGNDGSSSEAR
jgi:hypothetical protein